MIGAIFGDILGSVAEEIPRHPRRTELTPTDDSFLTCACKEWIDGMTAKEVSEFLITQKNTDLFELEAIKALKRWWGYFPEQGFSSGFNKWAKMERPPRGTRNTNGCLMRNSPIVPGLLDKSIFIRSDIISIAQLFAGITHYNEESLDAVALHTEMIFLATMNELDKNTLKEVLLSIKRDGFILKPVSYWKEQTEFIWDAPRSLSIAVAAILEADSYKQAIDNCCYIGKDADTYAAIAGPIAQLLWGIDEGTHKLCVEKLAKFPQIKKLYQL